MDMAKHKLKKQNKQLDFKLSGAGTYRAFCLEAGFRYAGNPGHNVLPRCALC